MYTRQKAETHASGDARELGHASGDTHELEDAHELGNYSSVGTSYINHELQLMVNSERFSLDFSPSSDPTSDRSHIYNQ